MRTDLWWWLYGASSLGDQAARTITWNPTQLHYPDTEPTCPCPILIMPSSWLGSDKYQFVKLLVWLDHWVEPMTCTLPVRPPRLVKPLDRANLKLYGRMKTSTSSYIMQHRYLCTHFMLLGAQHQWPLPNPRASLNRLVQTSSPPSRRNQWSSATLRFNQPTKNRYYTLILVKRLRRESCFGRQVMGFEPKVQTLAWGQSNDLSIYIYIYIYIYTFHYTALCPHY